MKKTKIAFLTLVTLTLAMVGATLYCRWVIARELAKYGYKDGIFIHPAFDLLKPYTTHLLFLRFAWIGFAVVTAAWIGLGVWLWLRVEKSRA